MEKQLFGEFDEAGFHFKTMEDGKAFYITATKGDEVVAERTVPIHYFPRYGWDGVDLARIEDETEKLIAELTAPPAVLPQK